MSFHQGNDMGTKTGRGLCLCAVSAKGVVRGLRPRSSGFGGQCPSGHLSDPLTLIRRNIAGPVQGRFTGYGA